MAALYTFWATSLVPQLPDEMFSHPFYTFVDEETPTTAPGINEISIDIVADSLDEAEELIENLSPHLTHLDLKYRTPLKTAV